MFKFVGAEAVDGALARFVALIHKANPLDLEDVLLAFLDKLSDIDLREIVERFPIIGTLKLVGGDMKAGYLKMTPDERADFWKNILIATAKLAAKMA